MGRLIIGSKGFSWFKKGHPWIFRNDLEKVEDAAPGSIISLEKKTGEFLGQGFYSDRSKIAFRLISRSKEPVGREFWKRKLEEADEYRKNVVRDTNAYRMVYGESDGIPSLIVDRYGDHLVLQTLSQGTDQLTFLFADILSELFHPSSLILRNDLSVRGLEGLPQEKKVFQGDSPADLEAFEGGVKYSVDLWTGQKTGAFLDQRENRQAASRLLAGKVLDAFCYQGLFSLHSARKATRVIGVDSSPEAIDRAKANARLNGFTNVEFQKENVFDFLKRQNREGETYDGVILDPPAFAKSKEDIRAAVRGYKELNLRAIRLLNPGGILVTCSCSYNLSEFEFVEMLRDSAKDARATMRIVEKGGQSADHPVLLSFPESHYLKCLFLQKIPAS